jgi:hypothetical protein
MELYVAQGIASLRVPDLGKIRRRKFQPSEGEHVSLKKVERASCPLRKCGGQFGIHGRDAHVTWNGHPARYSPPRARRFQGLEIEGEAISSLLFHYSPSINNEKIGPTPFEYLIKGAIFRPDNDRK